MVLFLTLLLLFPVPCGLFPPAFPLFPVPCGLFPLLRGGIALHRLYLADLGEVTVRVGSQKEQPLVAVHQPQRWVRPGVMAQVVLRGTSIGDGLVPRGTVCRNQLGLLLELSCWLHPFCGLHMVPPRGHPGLHWQVVALKRFLDCFGSQHLRNQRHDQSLNGDQVLCDLGDGPPFSVRLETQLFVAQSIQSRKQHLLAGLQEMEGGTAFGG